jgi:UDP-N-acetylmuramate--alanine ligase
MMFQGKIRHIHFVGIGGSGMSGIAEVLLNQGFIITGSDMKTSKTIERLRSLGAQINLGHTASHIDGAHVLVTSTAIPKSNVEVVEAHERNIPVIPRAEMLAELMRMKYGLAIAGSHGKTTTTSMVAMCLVAGGMDPTTVIGGRLDAFGSSAKLGHGDYLVAEADESDGSFMLLSPTIAVVTNIDPEHLDHWKTEDNLIQGFHKFVSKVPFFGCAVLCYDDRRVRSIIPSIQRRIITYGLDSNADVRAIHIRQEGLETSFIVVHKQESLGRVSISMPGIHNILNSLAAIAISLELNIPFATIQRGLHQFSGVNRRFTVRSVAPKEQQGEDITLVDDYAHHPTEILATLKAARQAWPSRRIIGVFQPHRFTRLRDHWSEFSTCFDNVDQVVVCPVYTAGEKPIEGIDGNSIAQAIGEKAVSVTSLEQAHQTIVDQWEGDDVIITLGAGNVNTLCSTLGDLLHG